MRAYHFGLIGYPVKHSLSPFIHKHFLEETGIEGEYSIIEIDPDGDFDDAIASLQDMHLDGFNVTVPYKQKIMDYLDEIDESAEKIGAVNTVLCKNGHFIGYNTDGIGYVRSLEAHFPELKNKKNEAILILGAGGAAKGIYHGLRNEGYHHITVANRTIAKASAIASETNTMTIEEAEQTLGDFKIVIQTTSVGMKPDTGNSVISLEQMKKGTVASDIVYQPLKTKFLQEAEEKQALIHTGHTMLLHQAKYAFEIWTHQQPTVDELDVALQKQLEG